MPDSKTTKARGIHHIAISTANLKTQLEFFSDVLGMELVALFEMHGVPGGRHAFLEGSADCLVSFVELPQIAEIDSTYGVTHAGNGASPTAAGTMQHLALKAESKDELLTMRDRIRSRGVNVIGPIDHGMCQSIYFAGPEKLTLEIAWGDEAVDARDWIDLAVAEAAGISQQELERMKAPVAFERPADPIPQPAIDPSKPHMRYPRAVYEKILEMSDEALGRSMSFSDPPNAPTKR